MKSSDKIAEIMKLVDEAGVRNPEFEAIKIILDESLGLRSGRFETPYHLADGRILVLNTDVRPEDGVKVASFDIYSKDEYAAINCGQTV